jgi:hypothetical protein
MNIYIYFHICCINNWKDVFNNLFNKIKDSGLYDIIKEIRCGILGNHEFYDPLFTDPKINIFGMSDNLNQYELFTLNKLYEDSKKEKFKVLYIHTKGVRHNNQNINVNDWIEYLSYFNIEKYKRCIELLDEYDTVGVNLTKENPIHYSGNFWWSKSEYINKLEVCKFTCYNSPEFWLTERNIGIYYNLWSSNVNHYPLFGQENK